MAMPYCDTDEEFLGMTAPLPCTCPGHMLVQAVNCQLPCPGIAALPHMVLAPLDASMFSAVRCSCKEGTSVDGYVRISIGCSRGGWGDVAVQRLHHADC